MAAAPQMQMDGIGTAPPWMRNAPANGGIMDAGMPGAMTSLRGQLAGIMAGSGGPGNAMGGGTSPFMASSPDGAIGGTAGPMRAGAGFTNQGGAMDNPVSMGQGGAVMDTMGGPMRGGLASGFSNIGQAMGDSMSGAGGPSTPGAGMTGIADPGASTGNPVSPSGQSDLHQQLSQAYDAASGAGSSALQPANPTTSGLHAKSLSASAPVQAQLTSATAATPAATTPAATPAAATPAATPTSSGNTSQTDYLQSLLGNPGGPSGGSAPAATPASTPAAVGQGSAAAPAAGTPGQTPSSIITGSQASYRGGPNVTTAGVNYNGMPQVSQDFSADAQRASDAAYKGATTYFDTDFGRQNQDLASQLSAQGFAPGSEGFNRQMELAQRSQDTARTQAAQQAQQIGFQQSGDLMQRALAARQQAVGEQQNDADRAFGQSMGIAGLGLTGRGQDMGLQSAQANASGAAQAAGASRDAANYRADIDAQLQLRQLGLQGDNQDFNHAMQLAQMSQGTVPGLNFGPATPLDVGSAYGIAGSNNNANLNRSASNTNALYNLGGSLIGSYFSGH